MSKLPGFIIIGAGKAGTTSLQQYLDQHPQIYLCPKKETFYFTNEKHRQNHIKYGAVQTFEEYAALFDAATGEETLGEISTTYYSHPESADLIHDTIPDTKIIAILRNPIQRAFSSYQMHVGNGSERRPFEEVIKPDIKYIRNGFYHAHLKPYYETFSSSQIKVFLYDDYCQDAASFLQSLFDFIGVDRDFEPDTSQRSRVGGVPKRRWVRELLDEDNMLRTISAATLKTVMPLEARQKIRSFLLKQNTTRLSLDSESYVKLADIYRDDIHQLQTLLGRNLDHWLTSK